MALSESGARRLRGTRPRVCQHPWPFHYREPFLDGNILDRFGHMQQALVSVAKTVGNFRQQQALATVFHM
jgi:hypothetical protein